MSVELIFKIAAVGILVTVINQILDKSGRSELSMLTTLAGLVIVLFMVIDVIADLFIKVKNIFQLQ